MDLLKIKITKKYKPLIVAWPITYRCNKKCKYCVVHDRNDKELDTKECFRLIDTLKKKGTKVLTITGGEPTLRKDISKILRYAKNNGLLILLSTNGMKLNNKIVSFVDRVSLSLDGPEGITDYLRGKGSYKEVIKAIKLCKENKVPVSLTFVITNKNINKIEDVLRVGKAYKTKVNFQPMREKQIGMLTNRELLPSSKKLHDAIKYLIEQRKQGEYVGNSINGLKHFLTYPSGECIGCISGKVYLRLSPEGNISSCGAYIIKRKIRIDEIDNNGLYNLLNKPNCKRCWCANRVELNKIYNLELDAILNALNYIK